MRCPCVDVRVCTNSTIGLQSALGTYSNCLYLSLSVSVVQSQRLWVRHLGLEHFEEWPHRLVRLLHRHRLNLALHATLHKLCVVRKGCGCMFAWVRVYVC
jgi:DNA-binding transcriptional MocR family regulator